MSPFFGIKNYLQKKILSSSLNTQNPTQKINVVSYHQITINLSEDSLDACRKESKMC